MLAILATTVWAFWIEPSSLVIKQVRIEVRQWPPEDAGLRLAILGDLHVGAPHVRLGDLKTIVERTNGQSPDLVVLLGDYVTGVLGGRKVAPEDIAAVLKELRAPLGVVAVLGNHDWWLDGSRMRHALETANITVLENDALRVGNAAKPFYIAGLADLWTRTPDIKSTLAQIHDDAPVILLTHSPDVFPEVPEQVSLTLAAHTHGGQVDLPWFGRPVVPSAYGQRYAAGLIEEGGRHLFVTTGIGTSIIPVRFRVPPEVVLMTLLPAQK